MGEYSLSVNNVNSSDNSAVGIIFISSSACRGRRMPGFMPIFGNVYVVLV